MPWGMINPVVIWAVLFHYSEVKEIRTYSFCTVLREPLANSVSQLVLKVMDVNVSNSATGGLTSHLEHLEGLCWWKGDS